MGERIKEGEKETGRKAGRHIIYIHTHSHTYNLYCCCDKISDETNLRKDGLILVLSLKVQLVHYGEGIIMEGS